MPNLRSCMNPVPFSLLVAACGSVPPCSNISEMPAADARPWQQLTTPSLRHALFKSLEGEFEVQNRFWIYPGAEPGAPPKESVSHVVNRVEFDGRFLVQDYRYPGRPFRGVAYFGFDNLSQQYQYVWLDSAMTGIETMAGSQDAKTQAVVLHARELDPITRREMGVRLVLTVESSDVHTLKRYETRLGEAEAKAMESVFTRVH